TTDLRYEHGPAYPVTNTLQSVLAEVVQDRVSLGHARALDERWSLSAAVDAARLRTTAEGLLGEPHASGRLQVAVSAGRSITRSLVLGIGTRAVTFTRSAPPSGDPATGNVRPLFWDPHAAISTGPYAQLGHQLSPEWTLSGRLNPGLALIDERRSAQSGLEVVPHLSAEAGIRHERARIWSAFDIFYYQGQFDGYRMYGARLTVGARDLSAIRGVR
ncbi:MAG TPA: hypothetical protein VLA09_10205, partial [Longimicrobiales bacterium]|nr:hypothetical protein [Longimicrobiales bacterium]